MVTIVMRWLRAFARRRVVRHEIDEEIHFHLERRAEEARRSGLAPRAATLAARRRFGSVADVTHTCRQINGVAQPTDGGKPQMTNFLNDIHVSLRMLYRNPGFALIAAVTLALGIGANSAVFTAVNNVLLSPLPYDDPHELVTLYTGWSEDPRWRGNLTGPDFVDYRDGLSALEHVAAVYSYREQGLDLMGPDGPMRIRALPVSSGYFETFRATPLLGRTFRRDEEHADARVVVLSNGFWNRTFGGDPSVVGQTLLFDEVSYTVAGVMRSSFTDVTMGDVDVWIPQDLQAGDFNTRDNLYLSAIGRLRDGFTVEQAQAQLDGLHERLLELYPRSNSWKVPWMLPMYDDVVRDSNSLLYILMGASTLVLLIASVNVANLALARSLTRRRELGLRLALGSGRGRLTRLLLTESMIVAAIGGALGLFVAFVGMDLLLNMSPDSLARSEEIGFDLTLVLFTGAVTVAVGVLFGLAPSIGVTDSTAHDALRESPRTSGTSRRNYLVRSTLVSGQVSLAVMLLVGAGLLMRSFVNLLGIEAGYDSRNVETFEVHLPDTRYGEPETRVQFHQRFQERLRGLRGVRAVGATSWLPVNGLYHQWGLRWNGEGGEDGIAIQVRVLEGDYFAALSIPILQGRAFEPRDRGDVQQVAILNETAARMAFGAASSLNRAVTVGGREWTVVGVVGDVAHTGQGDIGPKVYLPHAQYGDNRLWSLVQVVATETDRADLIAAIRGELSAIDPRLVVYRPRPMAEIAARQIARERFALTLMTVFAGISLTLAVVGLYGVLSYTVTQRFREMGIRMALGARNVQVLRLVTRQGIVLVTLGLIVGLTGAIVLGRLMGSLTFGISVTDPATFGAAAFLIALTSVLAIALPARRAVRADPVDALRSE